MKPLTSFAVCSILLGAACADPRTEALEVRRVVDPSTDRVLQEAAWVGVHLHGEFKTWYSDGRPRERGHWEHGVPVGVRTRWHATGHRAEEGAFVGGLRDGPWPTWYEDGEPEWTGTWEAGFKHGTWARLDRSGAVLEVEEWELGTRVSQRRP